MNQYFFIITLILISCSTNHDNNNKIYFVIKHPKTNAKAPSPPSLFYGNHNFILIDTSKIFYHYQFTYYLCGTGVDYSKPPRLFLIPNHLSEIKISDLQTFLEKNIADTMVKGQYVTSSISSTSDTIRHRGFKFITDYFKAKNIRRYTIRKWTEEEQFVSAAKIQNRPYDPSKENWRIGFDVTFIATEDTL